VGVVLVIPVRLAFGEIKNEAEATGRVSDVFKPKDGIGGDAKS
jgi:hypothetical protein